MNLAARNQVICKSVIRKERNTTIEMRKYIMKRIMHIRKSKIPSSAVRSVCINQMHWRPLSLNSQDRIQTIIAKLKAQDGVRGVVITNMEGLPLSSDLDPDTTENVAAIITSLVGKAIDAVEELKEGTLSFLTLDTTKGQINIAPSPKEDLILVVLKSS